MYNKDGDDSIIEVIVPKKSLAIKSDIDLNTIKQNDKVYIEIMGKKQELNDTKIKCIGKITKTKTKTINSDNLISNNEEDIIIETNDYENIDDENMDDEVIDEDDLDDLDEEEEIEEQDDDIDPELSEGGSIDDLSDSESIMSNSSSDSKLMD